MQDWTGGFTPITHAQRRHAEDLARFEHLQRHNLLDLPEWPGPRAVLAAWLLRAALLLDAHTGVEPAVRHSSIRGAASA